MQFQFSFFCRPLFEAIFVIHDENGIMNSETSVFKLDADYSENDLKIDTCQIPKSIYAVRGQSFGLSRIPNNCLIWSDENF